MGLKFKSRYSPNKTITCAQFVSEIVCANSAHHHGAELPLKFWEFDEWEKFFKLQIKCANDLLNVCDEEVLLEFVKKNKIRNLAAKWVIGKVETLQRIHLAKNRNKVEKKYAEREKTYREFSKGLSRSEKDLSYLD